MIEVLVALVIIALMLALLLPAVMAARESARRALCASNMRQIGAALHSYHSANGCFPTSVIWKTPRGTGGPWGMHTLILPWLEERSVYNAIHLELHGRTGVENSTVRALSIGVYLCPSDDSPPRGGSGGGTSYHASGGAGLFRGGWAAPIVAEADFAGDGYLHPGISSRDFTDGMQSTAVVCEQVNGTQHIGVVRSEMRHPVMGLTYHYQVSPPTVGDAVQRCRAIGSYPISDADLCGIPWMWAKPYTHLLPPGNPSCFAGNIGTLHSPLSASSRHHDVVNLLFGDGHVQGISKSIDTNLWRSIGSRTGGELDTRRL